mmetsp:Transcript_43320/g.68662  ORF Transcript_43320/g.68662 Transcript_43320/m.68662 type:complete len:91 (-) Transcript_43320:193-465(-)
MSRMRCSLLKILRVQLYDMWLRRMPQCWRDELLLHLWGEVAEQDRAFHPLSAWDVQRLLYEQAQGFWGEKYDFWLELYRMMQGVVSPEQK